MKRGEVILTIILGLLILLVLARLTTPREIDDINPNWTCEGNYLQKADIIWVTPLKNNVPISNNQTWCEEILAMNKTIGMHGIYHSYHEFKYFVNETELQKGKEIFNDCFGYEPTLFKPPYLRLSLENKKLLEQNNLTIKWIWNQNIHKVYHCENTGVFPNWFHDLF
ncbi:DUF2334 domain-containing protein [archaeon]|nr:DUF2334 domain-containing protein [archaeon]